MGVAEKWRATKATAARAGRVLAQHRNDSPASGSDTIDSQHDEEKKVDFVGDVIDILPTTTTIEHNHRHPTHIDAANDHFPGEDNWNDPWSSDPWNDANWNTTSTSTSFSPRILTPLDASVDSLKFSATPKIQMSSDVPDPFDVAFGSSDHHTAPIATVPTKNTSPDTFVSRPPPSSTSTSSSGPSATNIHQDSTSRDAKIKIVVQERLSILFDETTKDPICRVVGRIFLKSARATRMRKTPINSFCLTVRDKRAHVEHWDENNSRCKNITAGVPHLALDPGDQVFKISLRGGEDKLESPVVGYTCIPRLRPMPMLLKTKVHRSRERCRVGIRIRANPQNNYVLTDIVLLMIVPLDVDGQQVTMSRGGGTWDEMKRSLVWTIQQLVPGEIVDIQAQFKCIEGLSSASTVGDVSSKFPVLARCNGTAAFSKIDLNTEYSEEGSTPVELEIERSAMVLYRKV